MANRARVAFKVTNLAASVPFFVERMGFKLVEFQADADMAEVDFGGELILLVGPQVEDERSFLDEPRIVFKPGDTLDAGEADLDAVQARLAERGVTDLREEVSIQGERKLVIQGPDGYIFTFVQRVERSPEELLAFYAKAGEQVEEAIAGLTEEELDLTRAQGEWTVRQIVHHMGESASLFLIAIKTAIANSGSTVVRNPYDQALWAKELRYDRRPIEPSLALIKAVHTHIAQLVEDIPGSWERYILIKFSDQEGEGNKVTVGEFIGNLVGHTRGHCEEIRETRQVHDC